MYNIMISGKEWMADFKVVYENKDVLEYWAKKVVGATFKHVAMVKLGSPIYYYKDADGSEFYAFRKVPGAGEEGWKIMVIDGKLWFLESNCVLEIILPRQYYLL